ncbi:MAG: NAD-dependent epimerase/dehydratase family protein [Methylovirgula sp.]
MVIIVGGNGFIGSHVTTLLARCQREVLIVSRRMLNSSIASLPKVRALTAEQFSGDLGREAILRASAIIYLATRSVPSTFAREPWQEIPHNVEPAARFFSHCGEINPNTKLVLISSGGTIYGRVGTNPVTEDVPPAPISGYGLGKLMIEEALQFSARTTGMAFNILRISNPVGIYQSSNTQGIVPIALRMLRDGKTFSIFGDGSNTRDYVDADDVADAIVSSCDDKVHNAHVWNVGSGRGHSIIDVINLIENVTQRNLKVTYHAARPIDVPSIVLDSTRIRQALGWTPTRSIDKSCTAIWQQLQNT